MLEDIKEPADIKEYTYEQLSELASELRSRIIDAASKNGGHLASNLGMVEATIALHRVFDSPRDSIVFDVGHQCYAHKLLTGRQSRFDTLRRYGGISGFTAPDESEHDPFYAGHSGASLSAALAVAERNRMLGNDAYAIAVLGDASCSNGMIFEAMNDCARCGLRLVILLNDNNMSISKSVGGLSSHLSNMRTDTWYFALKNRLKHLLEAIPIIGPPLRAKTRGAKDRIRRALLGESVFECMGLDYLGPVDGHNIKKLESVLSEAKKKNRACVVHMITEKGRGYNPALLEPIRYHAVGSFDPIVGVTGDDAATFSSVFGSVMCERAKEDDRLCAITAAMCIGTGLDVFIKEHGNRFFDVGIEEEHAVAFAGGLGVMGMHPVFAVYSTFLQRTYDQIFHDVALQGAPVIFAIDRAGLVGGDGRTHQGIYDCSMLSSIPGMEIYSPDSYDEMKRTFKSLFDRSVMAAVRYPRGGEAEYDRSVFVPSENGDFSVADYGFSGKSELPDITVITYGRITAEAAIAASEISVGIECRIRIIRMCKVYPIGEEALLPYVKGTSVLYLLEEGIKSGGIAEKLAAYLLPMLADCASSRGKLPHTVIHAIDNRFIGHGELLALFRECGFTSEQLRERFVFAVSEAGSMSDDSK